MQTLMSIQEMSKSLKGKFIQTLMQFKIKLAEDVKDQSEFHRLIT